MPNKLYKKETVPEIGIVYDVPKDLLTINEDLRKVKQDKSYEALFDSIKRMREVTQPITCWYNPETKEIEIVTGNRRVHCAKRTSKVSTIPAYFKVFKDKAEYMKEAYHLNISKASPISELMTQFRSEVNAGLTVKQIASKYAVSEKAVYQGLKIESNPVLKEIAESSFKNAVYLAGNTGLLKNNEIVKVAKTGTIDQLKDAISNHKKQVKLAAAVKNGETIEEPEKPVYNEENKVLFFKQLENYAHDTINTKNLKSFLLGTRKDWIR